MPEPYTIAVNYNQFPAQRDICADFFKYHEEDYIQEDEVSVLAHRYTTVLYYSPGQGKFPVLEQQKSFRAALTTVYYSKDNYNNNNIYKNEK